MASFQPPPLFRAGVALISVLVDLDQLVHAIGVDEVLLIGFPLGVAGAAVPEPEGLLLLDVALKVGPVQVQVRDARSGMDSRAAASVTVL